MMIQSASRQANVVQVGHLPSVCVCACTLQAAGLWDKVHKEFDLGDIREGASKNEYRSRRQSWDRETWEARRAASVSSPLADSRAAASISPLCLSCAFSAAGGGAGHCLPPHHGGLKVGPPSGAGLNGRGPGEGADTGKGGHLGLNAQCGVKTAAKEGPEPRPAFLPMVPW